MKKLIFFLIASFVISQHLYSQGCVAIRSAGGFCTSHTEAMPSNSQSHWIFSANNRYFKSFRHFVGTDEQKQRIENKSQVINHSYALDLNIARVLNSRWMLALNVPINSNARSSLYEHDRVNRYSTHSFGLGDIRVSAYRWLMDPAKSPRGNVQLGLGIKFATGDYNYQDFFHKDSAQVLGPVDQSIQLGDGGTGFTVEVNAYHHFSNLLSAYGNFYYLLNPREQNGVSTSRGSAPSADAIKYGTSTMSVPDQYLLRAGVNLSVNRWLFSAGARYECLPSKDLVGGSQGFRRPGYIISAEPGISYNLRTVSMYAYVPVALVRDRTQSVSDKMRTTKTGVYTQGDAAFADYAVNVGISVRF